MTCIAANRKMIASDSLIDKGGVSSKNKKLFKVNGSILGVSGTYSDALAFVDWYKDQKGKTPKGLYEILELQSSGRLYLWEEGKRTPVEEPFFAIGLGRDAALAVLHCGRSPKEAVRIACKIRTDCGGAIRVMRLHD